MSAWREGGNMKRGGKREGAGRPVGTTKEIHKKPLSIKIDLEVWEWLSVNIKNKSKYINDLIRNSMKK